MPFIRPYLQGGSVWGGAGGPDRSSLQTPKAIEKVYYRGFRRRMSPGRAVQMRPPGFSRGWWMVQW